MIEPTGGLLYHLRALRYSRTLWAPYREALASWLAEWQPPERRLLLIGPSGGYSLPRKFLARFESVSVIDPDPLARMIFQARLGKISSWSADSSIGPRQGRFEPAAVSALLDRYPDHAILFCNLLGQMRFVDESAWEHPSFGEWKKALMDAVRGRSWASYHDRLSGPAGPESSMTSSDRALSGEEILGHFYPSALSGSELLDHLTGNLWPDLPRRYFSWELTPGEFHLIEGVTAPESASAVAVAEAAGQAES